MNTARMTVLPFSSPTTIIISGPTGSDKTTFMFRLIDNKAEMFNVEPENIYYFYSIWQPLFETFAGENIHFIQGLPNEKIIQS